MWAEVWHFSQPGSSPLLSRKIAERRVQVKIRHRVELTEVLLVELPAGYRTGTNLLYPVGVMENIRTPCPSKDTPSCRTLRTMRTQCLPAVPHLARGMPTSERRVPVKTRHRVELTEVLLVATSHFCFFFLSFCLDHLLLLLPLPPKPVR